jgi:cytoskeleton protein RodZ
MALRATRSSIGERLRQAREDRGIDLDRAAEDTRIDRGHLEALESDAPLDEHHAGLYARIFLREYARYLGLDPKPLVGAYRASHSEPERPLIGGPAPVERNQGRWIAPVLIIVSVGVIAALGVIRGLQQSPEVPVPPETMVPAPASPTSGPAEGEREPVPSPPADRLVLRVVDAESWVQVTREGEVLLNDTFPPGYSRGFRIGDGLDLQVGNAAAVRLIAGGEPLGDLGGSGEVYTGSVVVEDDEARLLP